MIQTISIPISFDATVYNTIYAEAPVPADGSGIRWGLFDIDGWNNSADVKRAVYERPGHDGAVVDNFSYTARMFEIHGGIIGLTRNNVLQAIRNLKQGFDVRDPSYGSGLRRLYIQEYLAGAPGSLIIDVRRVEAIEVRFSLYGLAAEFRVPVIAPDPRKYGYNLSTVTRAGTGAMSAPMDGTMPTFLEQLRIDGPITDPVVTHNRTGWLLKLNATIGGGTSVFFNMKTHEIIGTTRARLDVTSKWFPLLPGANTLTLSGSATGGGTGMHAEWRDGWE